MAMTADALTGGFEDAPVQSARAFRVALEVMARPGELQHLTDLACAPEPVSPAAATLLLVLCDPETPVHLAGDHDTAAVRDWLTFHTGAPFAGAAEAMFALGTWDALMPLTGYFAGTPEYPDRSATLIVEGGCGTQPAVLSGPGIRATRKASLPALAPLQENARQFPLGLDFFFTEGATVMGLPRSTKIAEGN